MSRSNEPTNSHVLGADQLDAAKSAQQKKACHGPACIASATQHMNSMEVDARQTGSWFAPGNVYQVGLSPVQRIFASGVAFWLRLRAQVSSVSSHDRGSPDIRGLLVLFSMFTHRAHRDVHPGLILCWYLETLRNCHSMMAP